MPELPEVRVVAAFLRQEIKNQIIKDVIVYYPKMIAEEVRLKLINQKIKDIKTLGKYIIIELTDYNLISHLRMEGKYYLAKQKELSKHDHVIFRFKNKEIRYNDTRKFGTFDLKKKNQTYTTKPLSLVAQEPFTINIDTFYERLLKSGAPLKSILLNQKIIAGIGNIYADEICFYARIHPLKKGKELTKPEAEKILKGSKEILTAAIKKGGTTLHSFSSNDKVGWFSLDLMVHGRYEKPCKICKQNINKIKIGGRTTYFCDNCQKR